MLNTKQFEAKWVEIKAGFRNVWGRVSDAELEGAKYNLTELFPLIEKRYGMTKEEIREEFDHLMNSFDNDTDKGISPDVDSYQRSPLI